MKIELFKKPKDKEEAYIKWQQAIRIINILIAGEFISELKVNEAYKIIKDLK